jgi:3-methyladenine DNA glycosylase/8-oxoguanine DNA glycosylase
VQPRLALERDLAVLGPDASQHGACTADYLRMRTMSDPDVLLTSDLVVRRSAADLGVELAGGRPDWAPWRSYATYHLWAHLVADQWADKR